MISVIIPSYKNPKYLDLCIKSAIETQTEKNEIIVVLDGYPELSRDVIKKYQDDISVLEFQENRGMSAAINYGVYNATNEYVLVVSEDNVFCKEWDKILKYLIETNVCDNTVLTINQIEPDGGIYNMNVKDFGTTLEDFRLEDFWNEEPSFRKNEITDDGSTFPFFIKKVDFMKVGGFDIDYPSPFVVDWDFFLKCEISNIQLNRLHKLNFYHFVSKSTKNRNGYLENPGEVLKCFEGEKRGAEYFAYKWGFPPQRDENNKCKNLITF